MLYRIALNLYLYGFDYYILMKGLVSLIGILHFRCHGLSYSVALPILFKGIHLPPGGKSFITWDYMLKF